MRKVFKFSFAALFVMGMISAILGEFGLLENCDFLASISDFLPFAGAGAIMAAGPGVAVDGQTVTVGDGEGKEYLDEVLKREIVKIRPSDTPLDTLTRQLNNIDEAKGVEVGGWEVGTRDVEDTASVSTSGSTTVMSVSNIHMWLPGDTLQVEGKYYDKNAGVELEGKPLTLYVKGRTGENLEVGIVGDTTGLTIPTFTDGKIYRLGNAASETQAQSEIFVMNPSKRKNFCQIHMTQVEESVIHGLHDKKVDLDFGTYKEQTLWDFKRSMELSNLFGVKGFTYNAKGERVYTSDGLWNQLDVTHDITLNGLTNAEWVRLTRLIFEGNNGADRRILLAGPELLESIAAVPTYQKQLEAKSVEMVHGIRVQRIETNFGELLIKNMGSLFSGERAKYGMVLDMGYIVKKVFEPLHTEELELSKSGQRRVKAQRIIENYCLFAENLPAHCKLKAV